MALTTCKECKKEVSIQAKTCPYCGINNPGLIDTINRRVGVVVLALLIFLCLYIFIRHEKVDYQDIEIAGISENKGADVAKADPKAKTIQSSMEEPKHMKAPVKEAPGLDKTKNISSADTPQSRVMRMLELALNDGGLSHEAEIQQKKLQIERTPKPATGNKKAAKAFNAKGLASSQKGDFNNAVKMFEEANKLDKSDIEIVNNLGFSYLKQGNLASAQQAITTALTLSPDRAAAWENLGEVFGVKGNVSKAVACFSNAYRFSKDRLKLHQTMKKLNEKEDDKNLKQARAKAINWAENAYPNNSKNTASKK